MFGVANVNESLDTACAVSHRLEIFLRVEGVQCVFGIGGMNAIGMGDSMTRRETLTVARGVAGVGGRGELLRRILFIYR